MKQPILKLKSRTKQSPKISSNYRLIQEQYTKTSIKKSLALKKVDAKGDCNYPLVPEEKGANRLKLNIKAMVKLVFADALRLCDNPITTYLPENEMF